jgi:hypothetical protein
MDLKDIGWGLVEWILKAQNKERWRALVNTAIKFLFLAQRI